MALRPRGKVVGRRWIESSSKRSLMFRAVRESGGCVMKERTCTLTLKGSWLCGTLLNWRPIGSCTLLWCTLHKWLLRRCLVLRLCEAVHQITNVTADIDFGIVTLFSRRREDIPRYVSVWAVLAVGVIARVRGFPRFSLIVNYGDTGFNQYVSQYRVAFITYN